MMMMMMMMGWNIPEEKILDLSEKALVVEMIT